MPLKELWMNMSRLGKQPFSKCEIKIITSFSSVDILGPDGAGVSNSDKLNLVDDLNRFFHRVVHRVVQRRINLREWWWVAQHHQFLQGLPLEEESSSSSCNQAVHQCRRRSNRRPRSSAGERESDVSIGVFVSLSCNELENIWLNCLSEYHRIRG